MEVTTVSPSLASPTEGDDLCETDATNVAIHSVTLLICPCGLAGNGAVLCLLSLKDRNTGIFDLAFADLLFLLFTVPSTLLFLVEDVSCSPIIPFQYLRFLFQLSVVSYYRALIWMVFSSNNFNMYKLCLLCYCCDLPKRLLWLFFSVPFWVLVALIAVIPPLPNTCPSHKQCLAGVIVLYVSLLLVCAAPVVISIAIDFIKAKRSSNQQQPKRRNIVFFPMVLFILLLSICNFLQQLGYTVVSSDVLLLLNCIHSSIKPFIYFLAGRCWNPCSLGSLRLSLWRVFDEQEEEATQRNDAPMDTGV